MKTAGNVLPIPILGVHALCFAVVVTEKFIIVKEQDGTDHVYWVNEETNTLYKRKE